MREPIFVEFGWRMRTLREERGASLRALETRAHCSKSRLADYEAGRSLPPEQVTGDIDDALGAAGELVRLAHSARRRSSAIASLDFQADWPRAVKVATGLWRGDREQRLALRQASFVAGAYLPPAMRSLLPAEEQPYGRGAVDVDEADVDAIRRVTSTLRGLDNQYGGGLVRETAVRFLDTDVAPLLAGRFSSAVGRALFAAAAELTQLAGWATYDVGMHGLGQRYLIQGLRLAATAGDRPLTAEILAAMSHQAAYLRAATEAVDLARVAGRVATDAGVPAICAEAAVLEAQGHAVAGDEAASARALDRAERALDSADRSNDPQWIRYFDEAYLSAKFGHTFAAIHRGDLAERFARRSLMMDDRYVRGRQFNLCLLANSLVDQPKPDVAHAAAVGIQAAEAAEGLRSARSVDYLRTLADRLAPYCGMPEVDAFSERSRGVLAVIVRRAAASATLPEVR